MILHKYTANDFTLIQNQFIDQYMVSANGEFVKVYLYLLRCSSTDMELSLSSIADALNHTENDVSRALSYWEKLNLLQLSFDDSGSLTDISFLKQEDTAAATQTRLNQYAASISEPKDSAVKITISAQRKKELASQDEVKQLLYIAEQYMAKQLSNSEVTHILYFYDELHFSSDLIEYLIEYCISRGKKSIHYMRKVALEWAAGGVTTVEQAKQDSNLYHKDYYTILNAFGIKNRGPARAEIDYMSKWYQELGFSTEIILEACNRTINRIHTPSFQYTDTILQGWKDKGVQHVTDIEKLDKPISSDSAKNHSADRKSSGKFGFEGRDYDFEKLEQQLLDC